MILLKSSTYRYAYFLYVLAICPQLVFADSSENALFNLSLEELLNVKVTTASKFEESIHDAHASISIIPKQQIAQFGGTYLNEILERVVSVNSVYGVMTSISTRASTPWTSLVHHLVLINGRPSGNIAGGHNLYSSIPLSSIERIEYIRGPGSVLYGTNAYYGVFNIITKKATKEGWQSKQKLSVGSFGNKTLDASYQYQQEQLKLAINMLYSDVDGWDAKNYDPLTMQTYSKNAFQKEQTLHVDANYLNFSFSHYYSHQERFGNFWDAPEANYIPWFKDHPVKITNASYTHHFNDDWRLENHFTYIDKTVEWNSNGVADSFVKLKADLETNLVELNLFGQISSNSTFLAGLTREERITSNSQTIPDADEDYASIYLQYQQQLNDSISYMIGGQYVRSLNLKGNVSNKSNFVPRAGLIYDVNNNLALKLLYGEAYRHPQIGERFLDSPGIEKGNPNLNSEKINTLETQIYYRDNNSQLILTYYDSKEDNLITLAPSGDPIYPLEYNNNGGLNSQGLELEYKYQANDNWMIEFAWSKQENERHDGIKQTTLMPDSSWKLGVAYNLNNWQFGLYNLHYGDFQDTKSIVPNRELINPKADGFNWLTFKASTILLHIDNRHSLEFAVELKNILDEEVYYPQDVPTFYPINTIPGRAGRSFNVSLTHSMK